jgi:hemerythrin
MKWTDAYRTGIPQLDEQHRMLFQMSEDFQVALEAGEGEPVYDEFLTSLTLHVLAHFGLEEACMFRHSCPVWQLNQSSHQMFTASLRKLRERYDRDGFSAEEAAAAMRMVDSWLHGHIGKIDVQLRPLVEGA